MKIPATFEDAAKDLITEANSFAESLRVKELHRLNILDTPPDKVFDDIVSIAAHICGVPTAMIMLIDETRAYVKASEHGFLTGDFPREVAFCTTTIKSPRSMLVVPDARLDQRFATNPLVTSNKVLFYAGMPMTSNGFALGALCLTDDRPQLFDDRQRSALEGMARITERVLVSTAMPKSELVEIIRK